MLSFRFLCTLIIISGFYAGFAQITPSKTLTDSSLEKEPIDGIYDSQLLSEKRLLSYNPIREADVFWEKRIWRVIDTRQKMNKTFTYPERPFFQILLEGISNGEISAYDPENDKFSIKLTTNQLNDILYSIDTIELVDPLTGDWDYAIVKNEINIEDISRFRVKEVWFFDEETSTMNVRILGIAPIIDKFDENGNFMYERPLFWLYYPHLRSLLAQEEVFMDGNDASHISWDQIFEMRFFSSHIYKERNASDARLKDLYSGLDRMLEAEKIGMEVFNFEHDLWSY